MNVNGVNMKFAFIRATRGRTSKDFLFSYNWEEAKNAGLLRGAYHYYIANEDADMQAQNFLRMFDLKAGDLPPVLDIEDGDGTVADETILKGLKTWLLTVEYVTNIRPIIYCNLSYYRRFIAGKFDDYPIWIARYDAPKVALPTGKAWHFWQFSRAARVSGISEKIDLNVFSGSYEQLLAMTKK